MNSDCEIEITSTLPMTVMEINCNMDLIKNIRLGREEQYVHGICTMLVGVTIQETTKICIRIYHEIK